MEVNWYNNANKVINLQIYCENGFVYKKTKWFEFLVPILYLVFKTLNTKELIHQKYWIIVNSLAWFLDYCHVFFFEKEIFPRAEKKLIENAIRNTIIKLLIIPL